jgi:hypothetical protein
MTAARTSPWKASLRLVATLALSACTSTAPSSGPAASAVPAASAAPDAPVVPGAPAVPAACRERLTWMRAVLAGLADVKTELELPDGMQLPASSQGEKIGFGTPLYVGADGTFVLDRAPVATIAAVAEELRPMYAPSAAIRGPGEPEPPPRQMSIELLLVIDARAPLTWVTALVEALPANTKYWQVVAGPGAPAGPAEPAWVGDVMTAVRAAPRRERPTRFGEALERAYGSCTVQELSEAQMAELSSRPGPLVAEVAPLQVELCRCEGVDVEGLTALIWQIAGGPTVHRRMVPLALSRDPGAEALVLRASANGGDLAREAAARGPRPFRLQL